MFNYLLFAITIIALICIFYWFFCSDYRRRRAARAAVTKSAGTFDKSAQIALQQLNQIDDPTAVDLFTRGNIYRYNILGGDIRANLRDRLERTLLRHTIEDYTAAIAEVQPDVDDPDDTIFLLNQIEDFQMILLAQQDEITDDLRPAVDNFHNVVDTHAPAARQTAAKARVKRACAQTATRTEAVAAAIDDAIQYTDDPQNVHDTKVNHDLRETLAKLRATAPAGISPTAAINEARRYIERNMTGKKAEDALRVLDKIKNGGYISTFGCAEGQIFMYVWERCKHPQNVANRENMMAAVIEALADSVENGTIVCPNGRAARLLGSLVTLDYDPSVGSAMTLEAYRNQVFQELKDVVNDYVERSKQSTDEGVKKMAQAYDEGAAYDGDPADEQRFNEGLKHAINELLNKYSDKLSDMELNNLRSECYVYAAIEN